MGLAAAVVPGWGTGCCDDRSCVGDVRGLHKNVCVCVCVCVSVRVERRARDGFGLTLGAGVAVEVD